VSLVKNTSMTVATKLACNGAVALTTLVVASTLGPKGAGTYALVRSLPTVIAAMMGAGITIANPYLVSSRRYTPQQVTETTVALGLVIGLLGWAGWFLCGTFLHATFYSELTRDAALLVGLAIPLSVLRDYLNSVQQGMQSFRAANLVLFMDDFLSLLLVLPFYFTDASTTLIVLAAVAGTAGSVVTAIACLLFRGIKPWPRFHWNITKESILFGIKGHIGRMANQLTWRLDVFVLSGIASIEVVGYYSIAAKVAEMFRPLSASLTFVLRPLIASLSMSEARAKGVFLYRRVFGINLVGVLIMAVAGGPLILFLFGPEFAPAVPAFQILLFGLAAHGADGVMSGYNVGIGKPEYNTYTALAGLAVTIVLDLTLIPAYSLIGAAIASSIAYTVKAAAFTAIFIITSGVTLPQLFGLKEYSPDPA
jgi:O-antigen/teichoic acid export membrane protein